MKSIRECKEYIQNLTPIKTDADNHDKYETYEYNNEIDLVYDYGDNDFYFTKVVDRHIRSPLDRQWHRTDGPAHITRSYLGWYLDDSSFSFKDWLKEQGLSDQEKLKLRIKYAQL